jgi:hypothetical protein
MTEVHSDEFNKDDLIGELLEDELEEDDNQGSGDVKALKAQVEALEKEKLGLLAATKEERRKRQEVAERLSGLEGTINGILSQRQQQGLESLSEKDAAAATKKGLRVEYDDDGNAWIDTTSLEEELLTPYQRKIQELEQRLNQTAAQGAAVDNAERVRQALIGEDESYEAAGRKYRAARRWVEEQVNDYARRNRVNGQLTSGQALDHVFDKDLRQEFAEQFGSIDIVDIVTAEDSQEHFRRMLSSVTRALHPEDFEEAAPKQKMDSRFQQVLKKPSTLGNQANAKAGELSIYDKIGRLSTQDIMEMDEKTIEALMRAAGKE